MYTYIYIYRYVRGTGVLQTTDTLSNTYTVCMQCMYCL